MDEYDQQAGRELPADPDLGSPQLGLDESDLRSGLSSLAGLVAGSRPVEELLARVAAFAVQAIPDVDGAAVTLTPAGVGSKHLVTRAATDEFVREIDHLQYEVLGEGPCITTMSTRRPTVSGSLGSDARWPRFGGRVARLGVHSALSLPLLIDGELDSESMVVGAINAYARARDTFTEHALQLGMQFAAPAAVAVHNSELLSVARIKAEQLQNALTSRAVIDQAIGVIRSRVGGGSDEAFDRLRQISQSENVKLAVVAQRVVDEAVRRAHARHVQS